MVSDQRARRHAEIDAIFQDIGELPTNKDEWTERIAELEEVVPEHVRKEEDRMFSATGSLLDEARTEGTRRADPRDAEN